MKSMVLISLLFGAATLNSEELGQAKVIKMRGQAIAHESGHKPIRLKVGSMIPEKTSIETRRASFVRFKMVDGSIINVAPSSKMVINSLPDSSRPGFLSIVKGKLRATVTKKDGKDKLFIRTKTAAMGVRGTDFQVLYNPQNGVTNTITYQGEVAMLQTKGLVRVEDLARAVRSSQVVSIKQGQFSMANPKMGTRATIATKLNPAQFHTLKRNSDFRKSVTRSGSNLKVKALVPPGVDSKGFVKEAQGIKDVVGTSMSRAEEVGPPPEGFKEGNKIAPPAGGYVDMKTGHYISPPPGSVYDPNTQTYTPPPNLGSFDAGSGEYHPPVGSQLMDNGELKPINGGTAVATFDPKAPPPNQIVGTNDPNAPPLPPPPPPPGFDDPLIEGLIDDINNDNPPPPLGRVRFHMIVS